jgi:outer membrane protein assembly factor BamB
VNIRLIWTTIIDGTLDGLWLSRDANGILVSSGSEAIFLEQAGIPKWKFSLKSPVLGFGFSPQENVFSIAHRSGIRLVNRIGVTMKEIPLTSTLIDFVSAEILAALTEAGLFAFANDGRELWSANYGGRNIAFFRGKIFLADGEKLLVLTKAGKLLKEGDLPEEVVALSAGRSSLFAASPRKIFSINEDCEISWEQGLDDEVIGLSADELVAVLHSSKVVLYDEKGAKLWGLPAEASSVSTEGKALATGSNNNISYYEEVGDSDVFYEIMCRGESRCGTFVSSSYVRLCPKCRSDRITLRIAKSKID